jgi:hypothetical protein
MLDKQYRVTPWTPLGVKADPIGQRSLGGQGGRPLKAMLEAMKVWERRKDDLINLFLRRA